MSNTYTEEEFKKILKTLFTEKKRVKELQKQLEEKGVQKKFQAKLAGIHKVALHEEYTTLKAAYLEKERERLDLIGKLEKVRPALKKLVEDLHSTRAELELLKEKKDEKRFQERVEVLEKENGHLEGERSRLVERLAESVSQVERQGEVITALQEEGKERDKYLSAITEQLREAQSQLQKSDLASVREEYEGKLKEIHTVHALLLEEKNRELEEKERVLEKSYNKMRELSSQQGEYVEQLEARKQKCVKQEKELSSTQHTLQNLKVQYEAKDAEIRKAQQHLAKKVKESTILRDVAQRQKGEIEELQASLERMQNNLNLQQLHEEKVQTLAKEWQEKYLALHEDWQVKKEQLLELQKLRGEYEQMTATVSSLRSILGKREET